MRNDRDWLQDIVDYGGHALAIASEGLAVIEADLVKRLALERAIFIIGEAAANVSEPTRAAIDQPWTSIVGFRNVLAHVYQAVQPRRLVLLCESNLPDLIVAVEAYLAHSP